jgi:hypothetical protein
VPALQHASPALHCLLWRSLGPPLPRASARPRARTAPAPIACSAWIRCQRCSCTPATRALARAAFELPRHPPGSRALPLATRHSARLGHRQPACALPLGPPTPSRARARTEPPPPGIARSCSGRAAPCARCRSLGPPACAAGPRSALARPAANRAARAARGPPPHPSARALLPALSPA